MCFALYILKGHRILFLMVFLIHSLSCVLSWSLICRVMTKVFIHYRWRHWKAGKFYCRPLWSHCSVCWPVSQNTELWVFYLSVKPAHIRKISDTEWWAFPWPLMKNKQINKHHDYSSAIAFDSCKTLFFDSCQCERPSIFSRCTGHYHEPKVNLNIDFQLKKMNTALYLAMCLPLLCIHSSDQYLNSSVLVNMLHVGIQWHHSAVTVKIERRLRMARYS